MAERGPERLVLGPLPIIREDPALNEIIFPDRQDWLAALQIARRHAPAPDVSSETRKSPRRPRTARKVPKIEQSTTLNQGETSVKSETVEMQRVALDPVEARVDRLRNLNEHLIDRYLELAVALHAEHEAQLWASSPPQRIVLMSAPPARSFGATAVMSRPTPSRTTGWCRCRPGPRS